LLEKDTFKKSNPYWTSGANNGNRGNFKWCKSNSANILQPEIALWRNKTEPENVEECVYIEHENNSMVDPRLGIKGCDQELNFICEERTFDLLKNQNIIIKFVFQ